MIDGYMIDVDIDTVDIYPYVLLFNTINVRWVNVLTNTVYLGEIFL